MSEPRPSVDMLIDTETGERLFRSDRDPLPLSIRWFSFVGRKPSDIWRAVKVRHSNREVEVYVSPTGRSVRVYVDRVEFRAALPASEERHEQDEHRAALGEDINGQ